jgi:DedD protein
MGLFSFLHKNKQDAAPGKSEYRSQSDEPFTNARTRAKRSSGGNSKDAESDPILPEKKRARRRLIGAVVLVLAVVIVLPMILDPEPKPLTDDIAIQIPSRDGKDSKAAPAPAPASSVTAPAPAAAAARQTDAASLDAKEELVDTKPVEQAAVKPPVAKAADVPVPAVKPPEKVVEKAADKPVAKPVEKPAPAKAEKAEKVEKAEKAAPEPKHAAAPAKISDEQRALAILQGKSTPSAAKPADKPADKSTGKFVIQVAALATQEKIDELRSKLTSAGISSYTQKVATQAGDRTRIRVGPFSSRDEAEKARAKIVKLGLNATLVPA